MAHRLVRHTWLAGTALVLTGALVGVAAPAGALSKLKATAECRRGNLVVRVKSGDGPIQITGAGPHLPALVNAAPLPATIVLDGPGTWTNVRAVEQGGDHESKLLAATISCSNAPEIEMRFNGNVLPNGDFIDFGSLSVGSPASLTVTIANIGTAPLSVGSATAPAGFSFQTWPGGALAPGQSAPAVITCDAMSAGSFSGSVSFATNDADENPSAIGLVCKVGSIT